MAGWDVVQGREGGREVPKRELIVAGMASKIDILQIFHYTNIHKCTYPPHV